MGLYNAWKRRGYIRITNPVSQANHQHVLTLSWSPGMRNDFRDIRFTTISGKRCRYWIESYTSRTTATIWIKVPVSGAPGLILYYDNAAASSESSGENVFLFFDDFTASSLDTTKWTSTQNDGTRSFSNGLMNHTLTTTGKNIITANTDVCDATVISAARVRVNSYSSDAWPSIGMKCSTSSVGVAITMRSGNFQFVNKTVAWGGTISSFSLNAFYIIEMRHDFSSTSYGRIGHTGSWSSMAANPGGTHLALHTDIYSGGAVNADYDWVYQRLYAATEPTLAVIWRGYKFPVKWDYLVSPDTGNEYVFDPVNVNHGMIGGVGSKEIEMTNGVAHGMAAGAGIQEVEMGPVNIFHPIYPTATWERVISPYDDNPTLISVDVSKGMDDPMMQATFQYDTDYVGNIFGNDYMTRIVVKIPDMNGVERTVFIGIAPSSHATYAPAADKMTLTAVDYALYLTKQTLEDMDLALLPPADQTTEGSNTAKVLTCDYIQKSFQIGMHVVGQVSNATGTIIEIVQTSGGVRITMYPAHGKFVDDEQLTVGGVTYAQADGRSIDIPYTPYYSTLYPEDWVKRVLGGNNWMRVTGIEPYRLANSAGYWDTSDCPAVPFMFGSLEKKFDAIKRLAKYMRYIFVVKPRDVGGGNYVPAAYFVKESDIDDPSVGLDLPSPAYITGPNDTSLAAPIDLDQNGENQVDVVRVMCQDLKGNWLEAKRSNSRIDSGEGPYREFRDEPQDIATQVDLNSYADDMFTLYSQRGATWNAILMARSDLQLYQRLVISGFGAKIPDGTYRIIKIRHERACAVNRTHISFMLATAFSTLLRYGMTYTDSITEVKRIMQHQDNQKPQIELATVTANDGWNLTFTSEAGNKGKGRDGTSTPTNSGVIPVGAKIIVQNTRGGIVCIPVVAASGSSTDLLVVDLPTIVSAARDESDHNYWFLQWTPGANNTGVSVNVQTGTYPAAPGVVTGSGNSTKLYARSTVRIRIRFSGPSATYYIKLWGEKNGNYSATGVTATITSGADVIIGEHEDPEPIVVIDEFLASGTTIGVGHAGMMMFDGNLPFMYNGTDNIYIGGPMTDDRTPEQVAGWAIGIPNTWTPGLLAIDDHITITGPKGSLTVGNNQGSYFPPVNIKNILEVGTNHITIFMWDANLPGYGCLPYYVRSYFL